MVYTDLLGNLYTLAYDHQVSQYDSQGKLRFRFADNRMGRISALDVRDPLRILVFSADQQRLFTLDRTLSPLEEWPLQPEAWGQISYAAMGKDQQVWVYDMFNHQLGSMTRTGEMVRQKTEFAGCCPRPPVISHISLGRNRIFLYDTGQGIAECDLLGQFLRFIPLEPYERILTHGETSWVLYNKSGLEIGPDGKMREWEFPEGTHSIVGITDKSILSWNETAGKVVVQDRKP